MNICESWHNIVVSRVVSYNHLGNIIMWIHKNFLVKSLEGL